MLQAAVAALTFHYSSIPNMIYDIFLRDIGVPGLGLRGAQASCNHALQIAPRPKPWILNGTQNSACEHESWFMRSYEQG